MAAPEATPPASGQGTVVLDIGAGTGALSVVTPAAWAGREIEIRGRGRPWTGRHTAVRRRDLPGASCYAAVFPTVPAGPVEFRLIGDASGGLGSARVDAGGVAEVTWDPDEPATTARS